MRTNLLFRIALVVLGVSAPARSHEMADHRHLWVSVDAEQVDVLIGYTMGEGSASRMVDGVIDVDGDGELSLPQELLAARQVLLPRVLEGLTITLDGDVVEAEVVSMRFAPQDRQAGGGGWEAGVHLRYELPDSESCTAIAFVVDEGADWTQLEAQFYDGVGVEPAVEASPDGARVWGPEVLEGEVTFCLSP